MAKRKIEFVTTVRINHEEYEAGDSRGFPEDEAQRYIDLGWAKDPETGEQGELVPGAVALNVADTAQDLPE